MQTKSEAQFEQHRFVKVMTQEVIKELGGDDGFRESKTHYELVTNPTKYYQKRPKDIVKLYENEKQYGIVASTDKIEMTGLVKKGEENED